VDIAPASLDDEQGGDGWAPLPDTSALPILALSASDGTVLGRSLRQVVRSLDDPNGVISAFDSFASGR
jgi:FXSXX-COOH protein